MPLVKVKKPGLRTREEKSRRVVELKVGTELEVTDRLYKAFKDKLALVGEPAKESEDMGDEDLDRSGEDLFDVESASVDELKAKAEELGIEGFERWGERRLRETIAGALGALEEGEEE